MGQHLSDTIAEYIGSSESRGEKPSTVRNKRRSLDHLLTVVGNIQTKNVTALHVDGFFAAMQSRGHSPGTLNNHLFTLRHFFRWCATRGYRSRNDDPLAGRRPFRVDEKRRMIVPRLGFDHLLDSATHPRDRMVIALGLYLFLRQGEIASLRIGDVDLDGGIIHVTVHKTGQLDPMPICAELDAELRRWLSYYAADSGPLQSSFYLCPSKLQPKWQGAGQGRLVEVEREGPTLRPTMKIQKVENCAKRALELAGYPIRDASGKSTMEGIHTLRRSGARALFDDLLESRVYHDAGRLVQAMLHHKNFTMTERYLQLDVDRKRRDDILRGKPMFTPLDTSNVVELRREAQ